MHFCFTIFLYNLYNTYLFGYNKMSRLYRKNTINGHFLFSTYFKYLCLDTIFWGSIFKLCYIQKPSYNEPDVLKRYNIQCHHIVQIKEHYENIPIQIYWKFYHQKNENFQIKYSDIFHISAQNIDCGYSLEPPRRGGSNEYPQSMFFSRNNKNNVHLANPSFTI